MFILRALKKYEAIVESLEITIERQNMDESFTLQKRHVVTCAFNDANRRRKD